MILVPTRVVGIPRFGVVKTGLVANTNKPVPVSSLIAVARFALVGCARKVAIPPHRPLIPLETGRPVQLVRVPDEGVPKGHPDVRPVTAPVSPLKVWTPVLVKVTEPVEPDTVRYVLPTALTRLEQHL